jgi:hypothetical protein
VSAAARLDRLIELQHEALRDVQAQQRQLRARRGITTCRELRALQELQARSWAAFSRTREAFHELRPLLERGEVRPA